MPRLAICSRDLHWHWINRTLLCDTMEVSMLSRAWLTIAQHVFQPVLTGGPELISRKIVSGEPGTKAIAVSRFREKLSPANWVQGVTVISRKISRSWAPKKWGPTCDRDISNSAIYTTAIYRAYTVSLNWNGPQGCCICNNSEFLYPHFKEVEIGIYWPHLVRSSVRLSVCGQNCVRFISSTILVGSISYLHILSSYFRRCVACKVLFQNSKIWSLGKYF